MKNLKGLPCNIVYGLKAGRQCQHSSLFGTLKANVITVGKSI